MENELLKLPFESIPSSGAAGDLPINAASPPEAPQLAPGYRHATSCALSCRLHKSRAPHPKGGQTEQTPLPRFYPH